MTKVSARTMDFFDRQVTRLIAEKYGFDDMAAIRSFLGSETYEMLSEPELEIYKMSPSIVFDMWESEQITHNPRNSRYLRGEEDE